MYSAMHVMKTITLMIKANVRVVLTTVGNVQMEMVHVQCVLMILNGINQIPNVNAQLDKIQSQALQHVALHQAPENVHQALMLDLCLEHLPVQTVTTLVKHVKTHLFARPARVHLIAMLLMASVDVLIITTTVETDVESVQKDAEHAPEPQEALMYNVQHALIIVT
jgi:hypothetical protein